MSCGGRGDQRLGLGPSLEDWGFLHLHLCVARNLTFSLDTRCLAENCLAWCPGGQGTCLLPREGTSFAPLGKPEKPGKLPSWLCLCGPPAGPVASLAVGLHKMAFLGPSRLS